MKRTVLLGLLFGSIMFFGVLGLDGLFGSEVYSADKLVFNTEREYVQFKQSLVPDSVKVLEASVLSSEPPIIVTFRVSLPRGETFSYGREVPMPWPIFGLFALALGFITAVLGDVLKSYGS